VVLFGRQAEIAGEYLKKGRPVYIEGRLQTRKYTDKEGVEKYSTEVVGDRMQLLGSRDGGSGGDAEFSGGGRREGAAPAGSAKPAAAGKKNVDDFDDDIPF
jgi:single-strand DNA-binding protein